MPDLRAVIDTNIVFEGLTQRGGVAGAIIEAWLAGLFTPCLTHTLAYEYADVLSRKLSPSRWSRIAPVLDALLERAEIVTIRYTWRPSSPDPGDEHVIDCAMNGRALVVTSNLKDFEMARETLGLPVSKPLEFVGLFVDITEDGSL